MTKETNQEISNTKPKPMSDSKESKTPVILFLIMIVSGVALAFFGDKNNDLQRYAFIMVTSLGVGLGATYLTGKITGGGKLDFINVKSASGGFLLFLISLNTFIYFFPKKEDDPYKIQKYFNLATLSEFGINASFIDVKNNSVPIEPNALYSILENVNVQRTSSQTLLIITFKFSKAQMKDNKDFNFSFYPAFRKYITPAIREAEGWNSPAFNLYKPNQFSEKISFIVKLK